MWEPSPTLITSIATIIASGLTAWGMVRVATKSRPTTADDNATAVASTTARFERLSASQEKEIVHLNQRLDRLGTRVDTLERERHRQLGRIMMLRKRVTMHDEDRDRRDLPPLPWPRGTKIDDIMGLSDVANYDLDDSQANRGPRDDNPLGSDAFDADSMRGGKKKDGEE